MGSPADIMVSVGEYPKLSSKLEKLGYDVSIMINDVQPLFEAQKAASTSASFDYNTYHSLDEVMLQFEKHKNMLILMHFYNYVLIHYMNANTIKKSKSIP